MPPLTSEEKKAKKRARWGVGGYRKRAEHEECPHPVKGSHDPAVEQCCMCGKQTAVKP